MGNTKDAMSGTRNLVEQLWGNNAQSDPMDL